LEAQEVFVGEILRRLDWVGNLMASEEGALEEEASEEGTSPPGTVNNIWEGTSGLLSPPRHLLSRRNHKISPFHVVETRFYINSRALFAPISQFSLVMALTVLASS
jgi:hypothetical protein